MVDLANMETVEKECGALGGLFQAIVNDMKVSESLFCYYCYSAHISGSVIRVQHMCFL